MTMIFMLGSFINTIEGQYTSYPYEAKRYDFINYDANKLILFGDREAYADLFQTYQDVMLKGEGKIKILHFGGSHIQADIYSNRTRQRMAGFSFGNNSGRGFIFPYNIAKTNNPWNYAVHFSGEWETCRNVQWKTECTMGVAGVTAWTYDTSATVSIKVRNYKNIRYDFNQLTIFHQPDSNQFNMRIVYPESLQKKVINERLGYTTYFFNGIYDSLSIAFEKETEHQEQFTLYGMELENDGPGIEYSAIGINGASFRSFLKCELLEQQLQIINPDWVIISLGTNDANTKYFSPDIYKYNYESFINIVLRSNPNAAVLLTVPNDSYLQKKAPNPNTRLVQNVIFELAQQYGLGVWDLYDVMGGFGSCEKWYEEGLMKYDFVHFSVPGYILKGDLLFNAFLVSYEEFLNEGEKN